MSSEGKIVGGVESHVGVCTDAPFDDVVQSLISLQTFFVSFHNFIFCKFIFCGEFYSARHLRL